MIRFLITVLFIIISLAGVDLARILGVYPMPSISHQVVFRALTQELIKRGHEMVIITANPAYKNKKSPANLREIDISASYNFMAQVISNKPFSEYMKRGVIMDAEAMSTIAANQVMHHMFEVSEVKQFIADKNQTFDLVISEGLGYAHLIFSKIFNAPVVLFSSWYGTTLNYESVGAAARHPLLLPNMFRNKFGKNLSIIETIEQIYMEYKFWIYDHNKKKWDNEFLKSQFGPNSPTVEELLKNVVLLLVNSHPIFDGNRPVPPGVVYLGAVHMEPTKPLPQDLKSYLDNSTRGVIYVSLGTNVAPSLMDKDFLDAFLDAFKQMPYDILWKFDGDNLDRVPKNVKIQKWFPQRDLLRHPNIKLFVMQGGLQSTDEAIDAEVPLVGIPILADQWFNVNKFVEFGIGVEIDSFTMVAEDLIQAVDTVANNPSYKENIRKLKTIMQDQPEKPIERGVWWVEHVLRHKGSRHLLGPAAQMSWSEYLMLNVVIVVIVSTSIAFVVIFYIVTVLSRLNRLIKIKQH